MSMRTLAVLGIVWSFSLNAYALDLYIAPDGNDSWSGRSADVAAGTYDGPFASLERARDEIRTWRKDHGLSEPVTVHLRQGDYPRNKTFELGEQDGGTADTPIIYRAYKNETVRLIGGKPVTRFEKPAADALPERIDPQAREHIVRADLKALGIEDFGSMNRRGFGLTVVPAGLELFFDHKPMTLARWPNEGFVKIVETVGGEPTTGLGFKGDKIGKFTYEGDRPKRWSEEKDIWLHGFWFWDWADTYEPVESIDTEKSIITNRKPYHWYGYRAGARWYAVNLLAELDAPGEWYLDRGNGQLYFWPPAPLEGREACVSLIDNIVQIDNASHVSLVGLTLEVCRGTAIKMDGGQNNRIAGCTIRNAGNGAIHIDGGTGHGVQSCDIYQIGETAVSVSGGDRKTLTPGNHFVDNCEIRDYSRWVYTYRSGISIGGVDLRVSHNLIHDAPHNAIGLSGNEHTIEFNEVHHVCRITDDAGAFYMGRDFTQRGNVIRHNYWHHIGDFQSWIGVQAVYLDDWSSGTTITGNIFYKLFRGILIGGGRDNIVKNNLFAECANPVFVDARGLGWAKYYFDDTNNTLIERLNAMPYRQPPWSERYPELLTLYEDEPAKPKGNVIAHNISIGPGWLDVHMDKKLAAEVLTITDNLVIQQSDDQRTVDFFTAVNAPEPPKDFHFERIPVEKIGLYTDTYRKALP